MTDPAEFPPPLLPSFGRTAVRLGFITSRDLNRALQALKEKQASGGQEKLGQIMVEMGLLSVDQVEQVLHFQDKTILSCSQCQSQINVYRYELEEKGGKGKCLHCGGDLSELETLQSLSADDHEGHTVAPGGEALPSPELRGDLFESLVGQVLGNCKIEEKLGEGGMGVVYRASHILLKRVVALKVLPKALSPNELKIQRFFIEAEALGTLTSPHIVQIYNVGEEKDFYFIEMEYIEGGTLEEGLQDREKYPLEEAVSIMKSVCEGLREAHEKNIVHRDIKPANIMIGQNGEYKLTDFGLAKILEKSKEITRDESMLGTPHYMSPEQCKGQSVDKRSDVYTLGTMFYTLVTGVKPFDSDNRMVVVLKHMNEEVLPPTHHDPDLPLSYSNVIEKMMAKNPDERYQDAGEILAAL
ncbi:MAG: serine/threonine protein kinase, partial [Planctomycetota bacterium]